MRRRLVRTMVAVTVLAVAVLAVPLGVAVAGLYQDEALQQLVDDAAQAATAVPAPPAAVADPLEIPTFDDGARVAVYAPDGRRLAGAGPVSADPLTRTALGGRVGSASSAGELVASVPIGSQEQVVGAVRAALPRAAVDARVHRAWGLMAGFAVAAVAVAAAVAWSQARRLSRPLDDLTAAAQRLGAGDFSVAAPSSGVAEIDTVARALEDTAARLRSVLERERAFSADASHQLRTPLTALRLRLEAALLSEDGVARRDLEAALAEIDRLERTVVELLRLSRDAPGDRAEVDVGRLLGEAEERWRVRLTPAGRRLELAVAPGVPAVAVSRSALAQIVEVLVDNAIVHGGGVVRVAARELAGGIAVEVGDEGPGLPAGGAGVFDRRRSGGRGSGIGLALARSLAEAEGGRLVVAEPGPRPCLRLVLLRGARPDEVAADAPEGAPTAP